MKQLEVTRELNRVVVLWSNGSNVAIQLVLNAEEARSIGDMGDTIRSKGKVSAKKNKKAKKKGKKSKTRLLSPVLVSEEMTDTIPQDGDAILDVFQQQSSKEQEGNPDGQQQSALDS